MLKNYFKIVFRNLSRHKVFSFINIAGLAAGMACTVLILLWAQDELSYDKFFRDSDHIYLVLRGDRGGMTAVTSTMLAPALKEGLPEIKKSTSFMQLPETFKFLIKNGNKGFEENVFFASSNFFDLFSLKLRREIHPPRFPIPTRLSSTRRQRKNISDLKMLSVNRSMSLDLGARL